MAFFSETERTEDLCSAIAALEPTNAGYTWGYVSAVAKTGAKPIVIGTSEAGKLICGCPAFVRRGKLNRSLQIQSLPRIPAGSEFWDGLIAFCRKGRLHRVSIESFGSGSAEIPVLEGQTRHDKRWEFLLDLNQPDLTAGMGKEHRRLIRRAPVVGIEFRRSKESDSLQEHLRVCGSSADRRRKRGEGVEEAGTDFPRALMNSGVAEVFQAVLKGRVISSTVVVKAAKGAYMYSAGTDPEGMRLGASHFLVFQTAQVLRAEGIEQYNLGGTRDLDSGLAFYKLRFGTRVVPLESAELYLGGWLGKNLSAAATFAAADPVRRARAWFGRLPWAKGSTPSDKHSTEIPRGTAEQSLVIDRSPSRSVSTASPRSST
jgi:hypothetical protein